MRTKIVLSVIAAAFASACAAGPQSSEAPLPASFGEGGDPNFPPPVMAGVTQIPEVIAQQPFTGDAVFPLPVVWVRFGVTQEAAAQELADALQQRKIADTAAALPR